MRVLMTADCVGGVWTYALELADALAEQGVETTLAVTGGTLSSEQRAELRASRVERCYAESYALEWMPDPWRDLARAGAWLEEIEAAVQPDVVHLNSYAHAALDWQAPVVCVAHSCVLSWWKAVKGETAPPEWDRYRAEVERGLRAASLVVAPTQAMLDSVVGQYAFDTDRRVIPNGVAGSYGDGGTRDKVVLGAGRLWDEAKNLVALDRVALRLPWPVEVAGDPPAAHARPRYARLLGRLGREELARREATATVFCAPALYEPFGLAALEAAHAGCALVLGDIPSLREVWGDAALFADPRDDDELAAALERAMEEDVWRERALQRAREYTPRRMAEAYVGAYELLA
jgi:glycosyltransferase involved in cell wall biosynthesis